MEDIKWERVAVPQADGYDARIVKRFLALSTYTPPSSDNGPHIFDGAVAVNYITDKTWSRYVNAPLDHPNIPIAVEFVRRWPAVFHLFREIMITFHPLDDPSVPADSLGSSSHADEHRLGTMYATVYDSHGLAQALVHEMAHNKLRALGVLFESASRFILNDPENLYVSPIVKTRLRPMTAVFHAQYSFMHVTALNNINVAAATDPREKVIWLLMLGRNLPRMEEGFSEIETHIEVDRDGEQFVTAFMDWSATILDEGRHLLETHQALIPEAFRTA